MRCITRFLPIALCVAISCMASAQPANDNFADAVRLTGTNITAWGSTLNATSEPGEPPHAGYIGGRSAWWKWTAPKNGLATIDTLNSSFDTLLAVYTGTQVDALTVRAANDDYSDRTSRVGLDVVEGTTYSIAVDGWSGDAGSVELHLVLTSLPPPVPAAAWARPDPYGTMVYSSNFAGKVVILDFWATWCGPCKAELPDFVYLQDKYRDDGLRIVGASTDSTTEAVLDFLQTYSPALNYTTVMANYAMENAYGGISAIPTTFIIDRANKIRRKYVGTQSRTTFEQQIIPLLYGDTCLSCRPSGSNLVFSWKACAHPFSLESSPSMTSPNWTPWSATPTLNNGTNYVEASTAGAPRFFRLRMNY